MRANASAAKTSITMRSAGVFALSSAVVTLSSRVGGSDTCTGAVVAAR